MNNDEDTYFLPTSAPRPAVDEVVASPPAQTPDNGAGIFVPYKYTVDMSEVRIYAREVSETSAKRSIFIFKLSPWVYLKINVPPGDSPGRIVDLIKDEVASETVFYDTATNNCFVVEPASSLTKIVKDTADTIIEVPLKSPGILTRMGHRFFDPLDASGSWVDQASTNSYGVPSKALVIDVFDDKTIAMTKVTLRPGDFEVCPVTIWTVYRTIGMTKGSTAVEASFTTAEEIANSVVELISDEYDLVVMYRSDTSAKKLETLIVNNLPPEVDFFDMKDFVENVYSDSPHHEFDTMVEEIDILTVVSEEGTSSACKAVETALKSFGQLPDLVKTVHTPENVEFFVERITAKTIMTASMFNTLKKSVMAMIKASGVGFSSLTKPGEVARGVVAAVDPIAAWGPIIDKDIPKDFMLPGVHGQTFVSPFSDVMIAAMTSSTDRTTADIGHRVASMRCYSWIIRDVFCLDAVKPAPIVMPFGTIGVYNGMIYSTAPPETTDATRDWRYIIQVGVASWIGVQNNATEGDGMSSSSWSFGYFGIEDLCRHPFAAMKTAVETYLSLELSASSASAKTVASTIVLTPENTAMSKRITNYNLDLYAPMMTQDMVDSVKEGESVTLPVWYKDDAYTLCGNPLMFSRAIYQRTITKALETFESMLGHFKLQINNENNYNHHPDSAKSPTEDDHYYNTDGCNGCYLPPFSPEFNDDPPPPESSALPLPAITSLPADRKKNSIIVKRSFPPMVPPAMFRNRK